MKTCVICKQSIQVANAGREEGKHKQWCPSCGNFKIHDSAIFILDAAVKEDERTRKEVVDHFSKMIKAENKRSGRMAVITSDDAQAFGFDNIPPAR